MLAFISEQHEACVTAFRALFQLLTIEQPNSQATLWAQLHENYDRYQVWAVNVGAAFRGNDYKRSLDYRLRDAYAYKKAFIKILLRIGSLATQLSAVIRKIDQADSASLLLSLSVQKDEGNKDDNGEDPDGSISFHDGRQPLLEADVLLKSLNLSISSLYRIPVRQSADTDHAHHLARRYKLDLSYYEPYDIAFVRDLFCHADEQVVSRLGRMISRRRLILRTRSQRKQELQEETQESVGYRQWYQSSIAMPAPNDADKARGEKEDTERYSPSVVKSSLKATTFQPTTTPKTSHLQAASSEKAESVSSIATTRAAHDLLFIPPRPTTASGSEKEHFECVFCCMLVHVRSAHAWKKHVLHDLQPYICTYAPCNRPDQMFHNRELWYNHELQHLSDYHCGDAHHPSLGSAALFVSHMKEKHGFDKESSQLHPGVLKLFLKPQKSDRNVCPLCLADSKDVKRHLGRHLQRIALFSLPRNHGDMEDNEATSHESNVAAAPARRLDINHRGDGDVGSDNDSGSWYTETGKLGYAAMDKMQNEAEDEVLDEDVTFVPDCEPITWEQVKPELHEAPLYKPAFELGSHNDSGFSYTETRKLGDAAMDKLQNKAEDDILDEDVIFVPGSELTTSKRVRPDLPSKAPPIRKRDVEIRRHTKPAGEPRRPKETDLSIFR